MERDDAAVDLRADGAVAYVRVHRIGEVDRRRARRQCLHLALGGEHVDLVVDQIRQERTLVLAGLVDRVGLGLHQLPHPALPRVVRLRTAAALVPPVRGDPEFGCLVHLARAYLDLERASFRSDHGRVQ